MNGTANGIMDLLLDMERKFNSVRQGMEQIGDLPGKTQEALSCLDGLLQETKQAIQQGGSRPDKPEGTENINKNQADVF